MDQPVGGGLDSVVGVVGISGRPISAAANFSGLNRTVVNESAGTATLTVTRNGNVVGQTNIVFAPGTIINTFAGSYSASTTRTGWTLGGGVEGQLMGNWSVKAEYLYIDLGSTTDNFSTFYTGGGVGGPFAGQAGFRTITASFRENVFRAGLNYRWGG